MFTRDTLDFYEILSFLTWIIFIIELVGNFYWLKKAVLSCNNINKI